MRHELVRLSGQINWPLLDRKLGKMYTEGPGHGAPAPYDMRVFVSEQKCGVTQAIKRERKRRSAAEPVIGHMKSDHLLNRPLIGTEGDAANAVLAAVCYNFARLLGCLRNFWRVLLVTLAMLRFAAAPYRPQATAA